MIIYKVTNLINGKIYIGQTRSSLSSRRSEHIYTSNYGSKTHFHNAIQKYGSENFKWEVIDNSAQTLDELNDLESIYVSEYNAFSDEGYNMTTGGDCYEVTDEVKRKIGNKAKKRLSNPLNNPFYGKSHTQETRDRISASLKDYFRNNTISDETRRKISEANAGNASWNSGITWEEYYADDPQRLESLIKTYSEMSMGENNPNYGNGDAIRGEKNPFYGRTHSDETKKRISKANSGRKVSQETNKKKMETNHKKNPDERIELYKKWYMGRWKRPAPQNLVDNMYAKYMRQYEAILGEVNVK